MFPVALIILVSICAVQSQDIYGDIDAVIPQERSYIQDLIDLPKPLDENMMVQRCGKQLAVTLNYLCPPHRRGLGSFFKSLVRIIIEAIAGAGLTEGINAAIHSGDETPRRQKRQLLTEECCDRSCTLDTLLQYCPE